MSTRWRRLVRVVVVATSVIAIAACQSGVRSGCGSEDPAKPRETRVPVGFGQILPVEKVNDRTLFEGGSLQHAITARVGAQTVKFATNTRVYGMCGDQWSPGRCAALVGDLDPSGTASWLELLRTPEGSQPTVTGRVVVVAADHVVLDSGLSLRLAAGVRIEPCNHTPPAKWGPGYALKLSATGTVASARCLICFD